MTAAPHPATAQSKSALANDLRLACQRIGRRVRFESNSAVAPHQFSVLVHLRNVGPQTPTQLAAHDRVSAPSMTRTINCMVEEGLVERFPHPDDGRQVLVRITELGETVFTETVENRDSWMLRKLEDLEPDDLELLRRATAILLAVSHA